MKNLFLITTVLVCWFCKVSAQELTTPQIEGYADKDDMKVSFPFSIKGVPFSQLSESVWIPEKSQIIAKLVISYQVKNNNTSYTNISSYSTTVKKDGSWEITNLTVSPKSEDLALGNGKPIEGKTEYYLFVWQEFEGKKSTGWTGYVYPKSLVYQKHFDTKLPPVKVLPKDIHSIKKTKPVKLKKNWLNPQPIPPKEKTK